jgi:anti-sigma factor RsiW
MHASREDLLNLRDGDADEALREHVTECAECRDEVERLRAMQERLQSLPELAPPEDRWVAVRQGLGRRRWARAPLFTGLAAAASVVLAIAFVVRMEPPVETAPDPLVQRSQQLERELRSMDRGGVLSGAEAQVIAALEDRVALVDLQLASGALDPDEAEALWLRRVDLLMELRAVRSDNIYVANTEGYVL